MGIDVKTPKEKLASHHADTVNNTYWNIYRRNLDKLLVYAKDRKYVKTYLIRKCVSI